MEKLDKERYLKRVIVVCWIALAICFGIKLFGGNLFEIMCENENFIKVCEYADSHWWANVIISFIVCYTQLYFLILAMCQKIKYDKVEFIIFTLTALTGTIVKVLLPPWVGIMFDLWQVVAMPIVFLRKTPRKFVNVLIANILLFVFQFLSMIAKNITFGILGDSVLEGAIYSIDVFLMIVLYYCYGNIIKRKEKENG